MSPANIGLRALEPAGAIAWILYPTEAAPAPVRFGPYALDAARDAPPVGDGLPLVVISHGTGGTPWAYRGLAANLVRAGFAVVAVEHVGNSRNDDRLAGTRANLEQRPRHVRAAIDAALADGVIGGRLASGAAVIGHSLGGYTALAVAGGTPVTLPTEMPDGRPHPIAVEPDPRVRAVVLLAPAIGWFGADAALANVTAPILVRTGAADVLCPAAHVRWVLRSVPDPRRIDHVDVAGAGHFSFMTPFPPELARPGFAPAQDPPGFERAAYHERLSAEIIAFLGATIAA